MELPQVDQLEPSPRMACRPRLFVAFSSFEPLAPLNTKSEK